MGGGHELTSPDAWATPAQDYGYDAGAHQLTEALRLFEDAVWYLEAAGSPEEIQVNVCAVLSYAHGLLGGEYHEPLGTECQAWQEMDPGCAGMDGFLTARDQVVRDAWQLDGLARAWLTHPLDADTLRSQAYESLGALSHSATGARGGLHH
jgi:hypothetical protein